MIAEEVAELKEQSGMSENREENNADTLELVEDVSEDGEPEAEREERPQSTVTKDRRSSHASYPGTGRSTPDPDIESSVAYMSDRRNSVKRTKRILPADEPNEVNERVLTEMDSPDSPSLFRNILLTAAVNEAERERKLLKSAQTPESLVLDDMSSNSSSVQSGNFVFEECFQQNDSTPISPNTGESSTVSRNRATTSRKEHSFDDKSAKSETCLLDGPKVVSYEKRTKSAPIEVTSRFTQTEWSWIEDMKRFESFLSQQQSAFVPAKSTEPSVDNDGTHQPTSQSVKFVDGTKEENFIKKEDLDDDLFKEPASEYSSNSSDEEDLMVDLQKESFLPSIGPPKILQYVKESTNPPFKNEHPDKNKHALAEDGSHQHSCVFCKTEILENVPVPQQMMLSAQGKPSCPIFEEHVKQQSNHKEDTGYIKDELIDIRPHPPFGTKAARKAAKERAAERAREREIERQKVSGNAVNFYAMTRQMKTLTYSLASTKCMDDGWTVRPLTPVGMESGEPLEPFDIEINSSRTQQKETFVERYYTNGERLLVLFPDGTGSCYYPSGNPAVIISSTEKGKYSYVLQEDTSEHTRDHTGILGVFDPTGHGACYFHQTGKIRMVLTPFGGTYFDNKGQKKKKWLWYNNYNNHVHAPPFQPITFAMTKELSVRCMGQDYIIITYNHGRHTIRFNVGARLKAVVKNIKPPSSEEDYELQLKETRQFVNMVMERVQMILRFPHSTRINKLPLPNSERRFSKPTRIASKTFDPDDGTTVIVN